MENINDFAGIAIVGVSLSLIISYIKAKWGMESDKTKLAVIGLSIALGAVYWFLQGTEIWQAMIGILAAASTFWAIFLKK